MSQKGQGLLKKFMMDESGQSTTEYILILAVVVMIAMKFREKFKARLESTVDALGAKIGEATNDIN